MQLHTADKSKRPIILWLLSGCLLIFLMVIIGGITRLTGSGLSITEWDVIMGAIPPLNAHDWQVAYEKYRHSPQFEKVNFDMGLDAFKSIFFWEYLHRLAGRLTGVVFLVPFLYFLLTKKFTSALIKKTLIIFLLGALQGFLGWFMVKSGLVNDPYVSHYRLAAHLITAFITFGYIFWVALGLIFNEGKTLATKKLHASIPVLLLVLIMIQVIYGALVAGLHAGRIYNTFPKMGSDWIPGAVTAMQPGWRNLLENLAGVQFIHRCVAWCVTLGIVTLWLWSGRNNINPATAKAIKILLLAVLVQFTLGIITLLWAVPVTMGVLHQAGAFALFAAAIHFMFQNSRVARQ